MPSIQLSNADLALVRKALRRMSERHPTSHHGARYDRVCALIDDQLAGDEGLSGDEGAAEPQRPSVQELLDDPTVDLGPDFSPPKEASPFSRMESFPRGRAKGHSRVQSLMLDKDVFPTLRDAQKWVLAHHYHVTTVGSSGDYWRFRQEDPGAFAKLRTIQFRPGVKATVGE